MIFADGFGNECTVFVTVCTCKNSSFLTEFADISKALVLEDRDTDGFFNNKGEH